MSKTSKNKATRFQIKWDDRYIPGVKKITAFRRITEVVEFREGSEPEKIRKAPGITKFDPITLKRGISSDRAFEEWANAAASDAGFYKDVRLEIYDSRGQLQMAYTISRCWVSSYQALPKLDDQKHKKVTESITLENEGWQRESIP
jgi:phage tail-like protein